MSEWRRGETSRPYRPPASRLSFTLDARGSKRLQKGGRSAECIRVIDEDQGKSGAYSENRGGFHDLMARIAAGEVGIVLGLEVSRLARDNADWHQLLRIAGVTNTLILDETGIYDPNDGNDRLLLGVLCGA